MKTGISDQVRDCFAEYFIPPLLTAKSLILMWCWLGVLKRSNVQSGRFLGKGGSLWSLMDKKYVKGVSSLLALSVPGFLPWPAPRIPIGILGTEFPWVPIRAQKMTLSWESFTETHKQTLVDTMLGGLGTLSSGEKLEAIFMLLYLLKYIPSSESRWKGTQVISEVSETVHGFRTPIKWMFYHSGLHVHMCKYHEQERKNSMVYWPENWIGN